MQKVKIDSDNLEQAELRLKRTMQMQSEASQQLKFIQTQHDNAVQLLQQLQNQHNVIKKSFLFNKVNHFQSASAKLSALVTAAIQNKGTPQTIKDKSSEKAVACNQSKHLFQIFNRKEQEEEQLQIQCLQQKLNTLYDKIGKCVEEELLSEKVVTRIKKESRRAAKLKTIQQLQKQISKYKGWLQKSKAKLINDLSEKEVEQKVVHNLENMKLLMNKKIISNDYIYDQFGEQAKEIHKVVNDLDSFKSAMHSKAILYNKAVQEYLTQIQHNKKIQPTKSGKLESSTQFNLESIKNCFKQGQKLMQDLEQYDNSLTLRFQGLQASIQEWQKGSRR